MIVRRTIPLGEGVSGLYGGVLYMSSMTVSRQNAIVRLPRSSLDSLDGDSIDDIIDASINKHIRDPDLGYDARPCLPDKRQDKYDDRNY